MCSVCDRVARMLSSGLLEELSVCRGCLLSEVHVYKLDFRHESVMHMTCSLSPLLHAILMLLFSPTRMPEPCSRKSFCCP